MIIFINKLPIPSLKQYCGVSFALLAVLIIYANKLLHDINTNDYKNDRFDDYTEYMSENGYWWTAYKAISIEPWCIWVLINSCYCFLILFGKIIQSIIFGKLRALENQHIKDQFWNFLFLKFIFIFGVLNLENLNEVVFWCVWFSVIGFLSIHCQICKDRFEYLSFSASTPIKSHIKVFSLLILIMISCIGLVTTSLVVENSAGGLSMSFFMIAESLGLTLRTLYVLTRYSLHICDLYNMLVHWSNKGTILYYIDFVFEVTVVAIDFMHYLHMLIYGNFYLSMASLVICMELKRLFFDLKRRMKRHSNYLRVIEKMERKFPWATEQEMINSDKCAVCWETLDQARRLPCSHIFHHNCLRSWLEQDTSCPTCRKSLQDEKDQPQNNLNDPLRAQQQQQGATGAATTAGGQQQQQAAQPQVRVVQRNIFRFNGSRYFRWLPNFSLQITNAGPLLPDLLTNRTPLQPEQLNQMTEQVSQLFPHIPVELIQQDLRRTHSIDLTVDNILENRLSMNTGDGEGQQARNRLNNLLNEMDEDEEDNDDEIDESSADDSDNAINQAVGNNSTTTTTTTTSDNGNTTLRHRNRLYDLLNSLNATSNQQTRNQDETTYQLRDTNDQESINNTSDVNGSRETGLLARYNTSPELSEATNDLISKKRELILNSRKRYLERAAATAASTAAATSSNSLQNLVDTTESTSSQSQVESSKQ